MASNWIWKVAHQSSRYCGYVLCILSMIEWKIFFRGLAVLSTITVWRLELFKRRIPARFDCEDFLGSRRSRQIPRSSSACGASLPYDVLWLASVRRNFVFSQNILLPNLVPIAWRQPRSDSERWKCLWLLTSPQFHNYWNFVFKSLEKRQYLAE